MDFLRKYRHVLAGLLILLIALQIPIYWKQDRSLGLPARLLYMAAYYPQHAWARVTDGGRSILNRYVFLINVEKENEWLRSQNATLRGKLYEYRETDQENGRLRTLLTMRTRNGFQSVGGRIIALDASTWFQSFTIDVGEDDGIKRGMPVVTAEGLVGSVVSVAAKSAKVLPIVDMNSSVDVVDSRSRAHGMLVGRGRERAFVNYLERSEDVKAGDLLVTSGLGGEVPPGLPVAIIREVRPKSYGLFQDAYVETIVRFSRLENVLVLQYVEGQPIPSYQMPPDAPLDLTGPAAAITAPTLAASAPVPAAPIPAPVAALVAAPVAAPIRAPVAAPIPAPVAVTHPTAAATPVTASLPPPVPPRKKSAPKKKIEPVGTDPAVGIGEAPPVTGEPALNFPSIPSGMPADAAIKPVEDSGAVPAEEKPPETDATPETPAPAEDAKP